MERMRTIEVASHSGERVCIAGWLHSLRQMGGINFLVIRDGWGTVQAVAETEAELSSLLEHEGGLESVLSVEGLVVDMPQAPGGVELHDLHIEVITPVTDIPPVSLNKRKITANISTLLDHAVVTNRHLERRAILRLSAGVMSAFRSILTARDFTEIQTPKIVASATESGANVFKLGYFGRDAYLAQSPQFYKQIMVGVFERVFEVGPVFRAEPHDTTRHINEYVSLDVEFGFIENHFTVMALLRDVIAHILETLNEQYASELNVLHLECRMFQRRFHISISPKHRNSFLLVMLQMCVANLTSHHRTSVGSVNGHNKSMAVTSSLSQAIRCASGHSILTRNLVDQSFQTLSTCSSVEQNWSPVGSASISTRITLLHWSLLTYQLSHSRPTLKLSVTACLRMVDLRLALNDCLCNLRVLPMSD